MILRRVARPLLGAIFVYGGINALRNLEHHAQAAKPFLDKTVGKAADKLPEQVPTEPDAVVRADALVKIGAGLALGFGFLPRLAALLLTGSLVPTTLAGHRFWELEDPQERSAQQIQFLKNLGLLGGLILAATDTGGRPGLRWRAGHLAHHADRAVRRNAKKVRLAALSAELGRHLPG
jgi:putative oxidoreductase